MTRVPAVRATLALLIPLVSMAGWQDEHEHRLWMGFNLNWASSIHPNTPSWFYLQRHVSPPPRELWCVPGSGVTDTPQDCQIFHDLLDDWTRDYLDVAPGGPLPPDLAAFPQECASTCQH